MTCKLTRALLRALLPLGPPTFLSSCVPLPCSLGYHHIPSSLACFFFSFWLVEDTLLFSMAQTSQIPRTCSMVSLMILVSRTYFLPVQLLYPDFYCCPAAAVQITGLHLLLILPAPHLQLPFFQLTYANHSLISSSFKQQVRTVNWSYHS